MTFVVHSYSVLMALLLTAIHTKGDECVGTPFASTCDEHRRDSKCAIITGEFGSDGCDSSDFFCQDSCEAAPGCFCSRTLDECISSSSSTVCSYDITCSGGLLSFSCPDLGEQDACSKIQGCSWIRNPTVPNPTLPPAPPPTQPPSTPRPTPRPTLPPTPFPVTAPPPPSAPPTQASPPTPVDLSIFGFPYSQDSSKGWYFLPPAVNDYHIDLNSPSAIDCADECSSVNALGGLWEPLYGRCWCYLDTRGCLEPCIEVDIGIAFLSQPFDEFSYCEMSYCDYFDSGTGFCEGFDSIACEANKPPSPPSVAASPSPTPVASSPTPEATFDPDIELEFYFPGEEVEYYYPDALENCEWVVDHDGEPYRLIECVDNEAPFGPFRAECTRDLETEVIECTCLELGDCENCAIELDEFDGDITYSFNVLADCNMTPSVATPPPPPPTLEAQDQAGAATSEATGVRTVNALIMVAQALLVTAAAVATR